MRLLSLNSRRNPKSESPMCRTKKSTDIIQPSSNTQRSPRFSDDSRSIHFNPNAFDSTSSSLDNYKSYFPSSSSYTFSSSSTKPEISLSTLKDSILSSDTPTIYPFSEIQAAAGNFLSRPFTSSSSSTSWRCHIRGRDVVVFQRKLRHRHGPIELPELQLKLSALCRSHHGSLVKLLGASVSGGYVYLVYDYIKGGANLATCLRNPRSPSYTVLSTWLSRMQVATDVAHGLDYIHHHSVGCGVHNHLKSSSVIVSVEIVKDPETLQEKEILKGRICHFGTAELCGEAEVEVKGGEGESEIEVGSGRRTGGRLGRKGSGKMKIEGTKGYMAPEFQVSGLVTKKCDVYAFGVVLLELLSGEEALRYVFDEASHGYRRVSVVEGAREAVRGGGGGVRKWVDRRLKDSFPVEAAENMVLLGLECVEDDPEKRPDMGRVAVQVSKLYLDSQTWAQQIGMPTAFSVSMAPR